MIKDESKQTVNVFSDALNKAIFKKTLSVLQLPDVKKQYSSAMSSV
jgi:hypothetical protein